MNFYPDIFLSHVAFTSCPHTLLCKALWSALLLKCVYSNTSALPCPQALWHCRIASLPRLQVAPYAFTMAKCKKSVCALGWFKTNKWNQCFLSGCRLLTKEASVKIKSFWLLPVSHQLKLEDIFHVLSSPNRFLFQKRGAFVGKRLRRDSTFKKKKKNTEIILVCC